MNEPALQLIAISKLFVVAVYAGLWGYGGMVNKALRRILGSAILAGALFAYSHNYWVLLVFPLLWGASSRGYGAEDFWDKVFKRIQFGAFVACAALPIAVVSGQWLLFWIHATISIAFSVALGVLNPIPARYEETLLGAVYCLIPLFMV